MKKETLAVPHGKKEKVSRKKLLKSFGIAGFLFFLVKGLIWLFVFFGLGHLIGK